jgi:hypothetical protein
MRFEPWVMQVCIFRQKNCNSIVRGLWWGLVGCNNFFLFYFAVFDFLINFLFSENRLLGAGRPVPTIIFRGKHVIRFKNYIY